MGDEELTIPDVLEDEKRNLCNIYKTEDENEETTALKDSLYYTETEFNEFIKEKRYSDDEDLTILSLNIASLFSKLNSFKLFLNNITSNEKRPDIIVVVETHIKEADSGYTEVELKNILPGYSFFHKGRKTKRGGGVGIFVSKSLKSEAEIHREAETKIKFSEEIFENLVIKIPDSIRTGVGNCKKDLIIAAIYRQPKNGTGNENLEAFNLEMGKLLKVIDKRRNEIVIAGDMNLDLLKYETHLPTANYLDLIIDHRLLPRIVRPTRIKKKSATLIDHIMTKDSDISLASGIIDTEIAGNSGYTDHFPTFTVLKAKATKKKKETFIKSYFTPEGNVKRKEKLAQENWAEVYASDDPNTIYDLIQVKYGEHYHETKTTKTLRKGSNRFRREPWMTTELLADMRKRDRLAKIKERRADYKKLRNEIVAKSRKARKEHTDKLIKESIGNMKKHWTIITKVANKTNNKEEMTTGFHHAGKWVENDQENADNFNHYLANIGKETNEHVGKPTHSDQYYLDKHCRTNQNSLILSNVTSQDVIDVCKKFTLKTSSDSAGFQQNIVLGDVDLLAPVLAHLVNCSQKSGIFPEKGKIARVIPVYKNKGGKHLYENYRPISLLPIFSKIVEKLIYNKVFDFLVRYEILYKSQYGYRSGHNTTHATLDFIKMIEDSIEQNEYAIGIFCDLSKAFDTLNHQILLSKLEHYGIRGSAKQWFSSYLSNRQQYVEWNGCKSSTAQIMTGVPQGSILGPLLFLIYINDLPSASNLKCVIFADDTNLFVKGNNFPELVDTLNRELESINDFFKANQLKLNAKKTKMVCFRKTSPPENLESMQVLLNGEKLKFEESAVFLGITIDSNLSWEKHCTNVANKISRNNGVINRVKHILPPSSLKLLYSSLIQPHIHYGLPVWGSCSGESKKRIITIQKRAIRTITKSYITAHTEPRMKKIGILKFDDLYVQQCLILTHDCVYNKAPHAIKQLINREHKSEGATLRNHTNNPLNLKVPNLKTRVGTHSFCVKGPTLWNETLNSLKTVEKREIFKKATKNVFLNKYNQNSQCNNPRCTDHRHH